MKTTNKTRVIFLAILAGLITVIYVLSQNKNAQLTSQSSQVVLSNNTDSDITASVKLQKLSNVKSTVVNQTLSSNKNSTTDNKHQTLQKNIVKENSNKILAADALPPQPLPEGHEHKESRQHQNMPPPAPDSKYAQNHQHTNRPDMGVVEKH